MANKTDTTKTDVAEPKAPEFENVVDPQEAAEQAGLRYVSDGDPGIRRKKAGSGWSFVDPKGHKIDDDKTLERIRKLAVPPAYTDVWICARANGHSRAGQRRCRES